MYLLSNTKQQNHSHFSGIHIRKFNPIDGTDSWTSRSYDLSPHFWSPRLQSKNEHKNNTYLLGLSTCSVCGSNSSDSLSPNLNTLHSNSESPAMAATRAISQTTSCLLFKTPFALKQSHISNLCFSNKRVVFPSKRLFSCKAIYNPEVQIKEEGKPETLDYRVFFVDHSGKKVIFYYTFCWEVLVCLYLLVLVLGWGLGLLFVWVTGKCGKRRVRNGNTWNWSWIVFVGMQLGRSRCSWKCCVLCHVWLQGKRWGRKKNLKIAH